MRLNINQVMYIISSCLLYIYIYVYIYDQVPTCFSEHLQPMWSLKPQPKSVDNEFIPIGPSRGVGHWRQGTCIATSLMLNTSSPGEMKTKNFTSNWQTQQRKFC